jgi:nucleotide-binding universal stress UspA family protein
MDVETNQLDASAGVIILRNILVATDFSECSTRILEYACGIARQYHAPLCLFHWFDTTTYSLVGPDAVACAFEATCRDARALAERLRHQERDKGVDVQVTVEPSPDLSQILPGMLEEQNPDLIVVGTHGRKGFQHLVLGSVAERICREAVCPVLTIGPHVDRMRIAAESPQSILLATDFSRECQMADRLVISLAVQARARLAVCELRRSGSDEPDARSVRDAWWQNRIQEALGQRQMPVPIWQKIGDARVEAALQLAEHLSADLMAFTVTAPSKFADRFHQTDAYRLMCEAPCPVLSVHPRE